MKIRLGLVMIMLMLCVGCKSSINAEKIVADKAVTENEFLIDTIVSITLYGDDSKYMGEMFQLVKKYDQILNSHDKDSEIFAINSRENSNMSIEIRELIERSMYYSKLTDGLYDITIAPLVDLWDIANEPTSIPTEMEITDALKLVGYNNIELNENEINFKKENIKLDLGGIAKGFIADRMIDYLKEKNVKHGVISLGGNIYVLGEKETGVDFRIAVQDPDEVRGGRIGVLSASNVSIVTSGIYERFVEIEGVKYHHMLNPYTGYPENNELKSVTIVSQNSMDGDALSTSTFLLGLDDGWKLINSLDEIEAIFITKDENVYVTTGLEKSFKLDNSKYTLASK